MKLLFQKEWFGIKFSDLDIELSDNEIADVEFYKVFYKYFYSQYGSYNELPETWRNIKNEIVLHISSLLKTNQDRILSIGCGNGYIENQLVAKHPEINIVAIEPGSDAVQWIPQSKIQLLTGFFPDALGMEFKAKDFDIVYASSIDYVFNDQSYAMFLDSVAGFGINDFLLTEIFVPSKSDWKGEFKNLLKSILVAFNIYNRGQLWGYLRTVEEHKTFLTQAGFTNFVVGRYIHGAYWIKCSRKV